MDPTVPFPGPTLPDPATLPGWVILTVPIIALLGIMGGTLAPFIRSTRDLHPMEHILHRTQDRWSYATAAVCAIFLALFFIYLTH